MESLKRNLDNIIADIVGLICVYLGFIGTYRHSWIMVLLGYLIVGYIYLFSWKTPVIYDKVPEEVSWEESEAPVQMYVVYVVSLIPLAWIFAHYSVSGTQFIDALTQTFG